MIAGDSVTRVPHGLVRDHTAIPSKRNYERPRVVSPSREGRWPKMIARIESFAFGTVTSCPLAGRAAFLHRQAPTMAAGNGGRA
jgi:hypothetical protein